MKVLLVNHGTASEWGGGDSVQIIETAKRLKQRGHDVDIQNSDRPEVESYDLVHIFNCRVQQSFMQQVTACQQYKKPIVVSPIWISIGRALWGSRGSYAILEKGIKHGEDSISRDLSLLKNKQLEVIMDGGKINSDGRGSDKDWSKPIETCLRRADALIPNSWLEMKAVQTDLNWAGRIFDIAPYGVDSGIFMDADPKKFREYSGITGDFIMQAGRIEPGKNQAMLCWALKNLNIPIVLIGGKKHWPAYSELCKEISGNKVIIIDHISREMLASAYAAARVHSLISWMDTCGLVSLEAAINGTPVVGSTFGHELEYLQNDAYLANPGDTEDIKEKVLEAWETRKYGKKQVRLKRRILEKYNWEECADITENIYKEVIESV